MKIYLKIKNNSNYPKSSKFFFTENKMVIKKMKDEAAGMVIIEFIGLRSKMYSYEINNTTTKKCKGISKHTTNKDITIDDYRDTLFSSTEKKHSMKSIKSHNQIIKSCEITKWSLSCFDNKRDILEDGITTVAYGHLVGREAGYLVNLFWGWKTAMGYKHK